MTRRRFDGYIACGNPVAIGQVFFIGKARIVVKEAFPSKADWDAERKLPARTKGAERSRGYVKAGESGPSDEPKFDNSKQPPRTAHFFYGINYL